MKVAFKIPLLFSIPLKLEIKKKTKQEKKHYHPPYILKEPWKVWSPTVFRDVFEAKLKWMISEAEDL